MMMIIIDTFQRLMVCDVAVNRDTTIYFVQKIVNC